MSAPWWSLPPLAAAVLVALLAAIGVAAMRTALDRLHFLGPLGVLAVPLTALAIALAGPKEAAAKSLLTALTVLAVSPILTHLTARSIHHRTEHLRRR